MIRGIHSLQVITGKQAMEQQEQERARNSFRSSGLLKTLQWASLFFRGDGLGLLGFFTTMLLFGVGVFGVGSVIVIVLVISVVGI